MVRCHALEDTIYVETFAGYFFQEYHKKCSVTIYNEAHDLHLPFLHYTYSIRIIGIVPLMA